MTVYVDGDAFPNPLKVILLRAVERLKLRTFVVSNKRLDIGKSAYINYITVDAGADAADDRIVEMAGAGDLVITADIPLADRVISKKAYALSHHGRFFSENNIKNALAMRNLMQDIRDNGITTGGQAPFNQKAAHDFANQLNKFLARKKTGK